MTRPYVKAESLCTKKEALAPGVRALHRALKPLGIAARFIRSTSYLDLATGYGQETRYDGFTVAALLKKEGFVPRWSATTSHTYWSLDGFHARSSDDNGLPDFRIYLDLASVDHDSDNAYNAVPESLRVWSSGGAPSKVVSLAKYDVSSLDFDGLIRKFAEYIRTEELFVDARKPENARDYFAWPASDVQEKLSPFFGKELRSSGLVLNLRGYLTTADNEDRTRNDTIVPYVGQNKLAELDLLLHDFKRLFTGYMPEADFINLCMLAERWHCNSLGDMRKLERVRNGFIELASPVSHSVEWEEQEVLAAYVQDTVAYLEEHLFEKTLHEEYDTRACSRDFRARNLAKKILGLTTKLFIARMAWKAPVDLYKRFFVIEEPTSGDAVEDVEYDEDDD